MEAASKTKLTEFQKNRIWREIRLNMKPDDRDPLDVIINVYGGDEEAYLIAMARYLGLKWIFE